MIGVVAPEQDMPVIREFFELFKTPWEICRSSKHYDVVLAASTEGSLPDADLSVVYGLDPEDRAREKDRDQARQAVLLRYREHRFPVYSGCSVFTGGRKQVIYQEATRKVVGSEIPGSGRKIVRIGYDLIEEVRFLLSNGQPTEYAHVPTLDIHISIFRDLIVESRIPLVEIPPVPAGFDMMLCLTHDVDFASIRRHGIDRTVLGFLYRATIVSFVHFLKGKLTLGRLLGNLLAAFSLPLVHLGLVQDFFNQFEKYLRLEGSIRSTFFVVPHKNLDGEELGDQRSKGRATRYDVADIRPQLSALVAKGREIGLHGIDAWNDTDTAEAERERIQEAAHSAVTGVRSHWLFWSYRSPEVLEEAGFLYDSSFGYNETVGYRSGTCQVFQPLNAAKLLELPLHVQDTALFSSGRMGLSQQDGIEKIEEVLRWIRQGRGVITVNWHLRSIGPERQWDKAFQHLLQLADDPRVWVAPAQDVVQWFASRRLVNFSEIDLEKGRIFKSSKGTETTPRIAVRWYNHHGTATSEAEHVSLLERSRTAG